MAHTGGASMCGRTTTALGRAFAPVLKAPGVFTAGVGAKGRSVALNEEQFGAALEKHGSRKLDTESLTSLGFSEKETPSVVHAMITSGLLLHFFHENAEGATEDLFALAHNKNIGEALRGPFFAKYPAERIKELGVHLRNLDEMGLVLDMQRATEATQEKHRQEGNEEGYRVCEQTSKQIHDAWNNDGKTAVDLGEWFTRPTMSQEDLTGDPPRVHELRILIAGEQRKPREEQDIFILRDWQAELENLEVVGSQTLLQV